MKKRVALLGLAFVACLSPAGCGSRPTDGTTSQRQQPSYVVFFESLKKLCGQQFEGATDFPKDRRNQLVGKRLVLRFESCGEKEIRIPLEVGDDRSRTWVLRLTDAGLLFKHEHRHEDGTLDKITDYGGLSTDSGTPNLQHFPADAHTAALIPEAATNVWTLEIIPDKKQFMYYLERNNEPRYRAYFDLNRPLQQPPTGAATPAK